MLHGLQGHLLFSASLQKLQRYFASRHMSAVSWDPGLLESDGIADCSSRQGCSLWLVVGYVGDICAA